MQSFALYFLSIHRVSIVVLGIVSDDSVTGATLESNIGGFDYDKTLGRSD